MNTTMRRFTSLLLAVFALLLLTLPAAWAQQKLDAIAAIVGDQIVLESEIHTLVAQYGFQKRINVLNDPALFRQLSKRFLNRLIDQKLLLIKADEDTIKADEARVDQLLEQQLNMLIQQAGSQEALEKYYNAPLTQIKKELRREIENQLRIEMLQQKRFGNLKVSRREVEQFYHQYRDSLPRIEETVDISHILMNVTPSDESIQQAYQKIQQLKAQLDNGADFAELARKYSEDPGSASKGGDLGFVKRGDLVKEFEEVAFALKKGEISDIVQTQFGFHIIQLLERRGEKIHVRHILIQLRPTPEDEQRVIDTLKTIRQKILEGKATFEEMALKYSDDPNVKKDKGHLGRFRVGSFQIKEFEKAVANLKPGEISQPFRTEFGYHIVRLNERISPRTLSLEKDWEQIEQWALQKKQEREFQKWLAQLRKEIPIIIKYQL